MSDASQEPFRWYEYPVGFVGDLCWATARTLVAFLIGLGGVFLLVVAVGLLGEEGVLPYEVARILDQFTRASMLPVLALVWALTLVASITQVAGSVAVSRAVAKAARAGAPVTQVPSPGQVAAIVSSPGGWLMMWCFFHIVLFAIAAPVALWMLISEPGDAPSMLIILGVTVGGGAVLIAVTAWLRLGIRAAHGRRRGEISDHWWPRHEQAAWTRAQYTPNTTRPARTPSGRAAGIAITVGSVGVAAALLLMSVLLFITHPDAQRWPGGQAGERAELTPELEGFVDAGTVVFTVLMTVGLLLVVVGSIIDGVTDLHERRHLRAAVVDPDAPRPPSEVLVKYSGPAVPSLARAAMALGAVAIVLGWTGVSLGSGSLEDFASVYSGSDESFAAVLPSSVFVRNVGIALCVVGLAAAMGNASLGRDLRNQLFERWPQRPRVVTGTDKAARDPATIGPALTP